MTTQTDRINGLTGALGIKAPVRVATTANITLSGEQTIDGVAVVALDRVLVKDQTTATENGIYVASATSWARAPDFDGVRDAVTGTMVYVVSGTANAKTSWRITTTGDLTPGTTSLAFEAAFGTPLIALDTHAATSKDTPVDADELPLVDSAASNVLKKLTWANLKTVLAAACSAGWNAATATTATTATDTASKTGTGSTYVTNTSPTLITPALGTPASGNLANCTIKSDGTAIGYQTGAGGTVTQLTSKATAVTLNKACGRIVTHNAALAAGASVSFNVSHGGVGELASLYSAIATSFAGAGTPGAYSVRWDKGASVDVVTLKNETAGSLSEEVTINYAVIASLTS